MSCLLVFPAGKGWTRSVETHVSSCIHCKNHSRSAYFCVHTDPATRLVPWDTKYIYTQTHRQMGWPPNFGPTARQIFAPTLAYTLAELAAEAASLRSQIIYYSSGGGKRMFYL